jgi:serine/threonine-protein kinase
MMGTVLDPERRPTPRSEGLAIGDAIEAVFVRALALDPRDRYLSVGEFWQELVAAYRAELEPSFGPSSQRSRLGSGFQPAVTAPLGRHNLIPDLEPPGAAATALELGVAPEASRGPPSAPGSGQRTAVAPRRPAGSGEWAAAPSERRNRSGQYELSVSAPAQAAPPEPPPPARGAGGASPPRESQPPAASRPSPAPGRGSVRPAMATDPVRRSSDPSAPPAPAARASSAPAPQHLASIRPEPRRSLDGLGEEPSGTFGAVRRFLLPVAMVGAGILITVVEGAYASSTGQVFTIGVVRPEWIAGVLAIGGIGLAAWRFWSEAG